MDSILSVFVPSFVRSLATNGPAIWGGCVPPAGGWRGFCRLLASEALAKEAWCKFCELYECRGTNYLGARNLSRCRFYIACTCALCPPKRSEGGCPGATFITNLSWVQKQKLRIRQPAEPKSRPWRGKKCDKQLTHIVRVSC